MIFTEDDIKIIVSTLFSAIIGVAIGNALTCLGECLDTDVRDILSAAVSILMFLIIFYLITKGRKKRRRALERHRR